ncbi:unnamed protein product [Arctogadus glacialis]
MGLSEQRRKRLQELEGQLVEEREEDDGAVQAAEAQGVLLSMKSQRVQLMRQLKEDTAKFHVWKSQKNKEVLQLKEKSRNAAYFLSHLQKLDHMVPVNYETGAASITHLHANNPLSGIFEGD